MKPLSKDQLEELESLAETTKALGSKTFMHRANYRGLYDCLARRGLVTWEKPPKDFDPTRFAGTRITAAGKRYLASLPRQESPKP